MKLFTVHAVDYIKRPDFLPSSMPAGRHVTADIDVDKFMPVSLMHAWFTHVYRNDTSWENFGADIEIKKFIENDYAEIEAVHSATLNKHHVSFSVKKVNLGSNIEKKDERAILSL